MMKNKAATNILYLVIICVLATAVCGSSVGNLPEIREESLYDKVVLASLYSISAATAYNFYYYYHPLVLVPIAAMVYHKGPIEGPKLTFGICVMLTLMSLFCSSLGLMYSYPLLILVPLGLLVLNQPFLVQLGIGFWLMYLFDKQKAERARR